MDKAGRDSLKKIDITRYREGEGRPDRDVAAREESLEVRLNGATLVHLMRLPGDDVALAAGFCLSEGVVTDRGQIKIIAQRGDGGDPGEPGEAGAGDLVEVTADLRDGVEGFLPGRVVRTGSGGADLEREVELQGVRVDSGAVFSPGVICDAPERLLAGQEIFKLTGGTHGAGLFDAEGRMVVVKEDVGRHNALDKVLGHAMFSGEDLAEMGIILSGRLSYEMVLKAARAGVPLLCSVSAPTSLGIGVADQTGVTLVGFVRGRSFNVYTHGRRVGGA